MDVFILQRPPAAALAFSLQCPELSYRNPLATAYGPTSPAAKSWVAVPLVVPVTANPSPGRWHALPLLPPAQTVTGTHSGVGPQHMGWPGTCRPALHFPEGPISWPGKGYRCQEGKLEGWGLKRIHALPRTLLCPEAASGGCQPALSPLPSFLQGKRTEKLSAHVAPSSSPSSHYLSPRQAWDSQNSLAGGHTTQSSQAHGLA